MKKHGEFEKALEDVLIEEIRDGDPEEVSGVDLPAIARNFTAFKSVSGQPRAGRRSGPGFSDPLIAGVETYPARGQLAKEGYAAEGEGDDDCVLRHMNDGMTEEEARAACAEKTKNVPEGADPAKFEACLEDVMSAIEDGEIAPEDPEADPKATAYAICTAGQAGKREEQDMGNEVIPFPSSEPCHREDCLEIAKGLGLDDDKATKTFEAARIDFGVGWGDPNLLALPKGMKAEDLIASAAQSLGFIEAKGAPKVTLKGESHWKDHVRRFFGMETRTPAAQVIASEIKALKRHQEVLMAEQTKSKEDLRGVVEALIQANERRADADRDFWARALGIDPSEMATAAAAAAPAAPATIPPMKRAGTKDVTPAPAAEPAAPSSDSERIDRLEAIASEHGAYLQQIVGLLQGGSPAGDPSAGKRSSAPVAPSRRLGIVKSAARNEQRESTITGLQTSRAEREAAWNRPGPHRLSAR